MGWKGKGLLIVEDLVGWGERDDSVDWIDEGDSSVGWGRGFLGLSVGLGGGDGLTWSYERNRK